MRNTARQTRANRTITIDFQNEATYVQLLGDGKAFLECVLAFLLALGFQLKHKATSNSNFGMQRVRGCQWTPIWLRCLSPQHEGDRHDDPLRLRYPQGYLTPTNRSLA